VLSIPLGTQVVKLERWFMANADASTYGRYYWCIGLIGETATEVYVHADEVSIDQVGTLICEGRGRRGPGEQPPDDQSQLMLAFPSGHWSFVYAASVMDGHAVAVEHWPGQVTE
jgi:hypothetical protein